MHIACEYRLLSLFIVVSVFDTCRLTWTWMDVRLVTSSVDFQENCLRSIYILRAIHLHVFSTTLLKCTLC